MMCNLLKAENLPSRAAQSKVIDPYVTFSIARGDPLQQEPGVGGQEAPGAATAEVEQRVMRSRNKDRKARGEYGEGV